MKTTTWLLMIVLALCVAGCFETGDGGNGGGGGGGDTPVVTPAPGAMLMVGIGTACVGWLKRRRSL